MKVEEIWRVLKNKGVFYLSDFLICDDERYKEKYSEGFQNFGTWGVYKTSENLTVRLVCQRKSNSFPSNDIYFIILAGELGNR
jgi:hypothetical protein